MIYHTFNRCYLKKNNKSQKINKKLFQNNNKIIPNLHLLLLKKINKKIILNHLNIILN